MNQNIEQAFCAPGLLGIIDLAVPREDGVLVGQISRESIEQISERYPGAYLDTLSGAIERRNKAMTSAPKKITREQFIAALECLPPMGWTSRGYTESFKMSEFTCGNITSIYARIDERYYHMSDVFTLKHEEIIAMVDEAAPSCTGSGEPYGPDNELPGMWGNADFTGGKYDA